MFPRCNHYTVCVEILQSKETNQKQGEIERQEEPEKS